MTSAPIREVNVSWSTIGITKDITKDAIVLSVRFAAILKRRFS